jgi:hypothetical protein
MNRTTRSYHYAASFLLCVFVTAALAGETSLRRYQLPDNSNIQFNVPASWKDEVRRPPKNLPITIRFGPQTGGSFEVLVTPLWPRKSQAPPASAEKIRDVTQEAARRVKPQVIEKTIPIKELKGPAVSGYYFSVTDRAPKKGEYKFMTQGIIRIGEMLTTFTVLTNEGRESVVPEVLAMLKDARHNKAT